MSNISNKPSGKLNVVPSCLDHCQAELRDAADAMQKFLLLLQEKSTEAMGEGVIYE